MPRRDCAWTIRIKINAKPYALGARLVIFLIVIYYALLLLLDNDALIYLDSPLSPRYYLISSHDSISDCK